MIELNKVYTDGSHYRTPVSIRGNLVSYWVTELDSSIGKEDLIGCMELTKFEEMHVPYIKPMTFKRIKDEGIKKIVSPNDVTREVIGFSSNNKLVTYTYGLGALSWFEEEIKDWKVSE